MFSFCVSSDVTTDRSRINSSDMQCRRLSVWSVNFNFITFSFQNYFFQRVGEGVYIKLVEILEGWGGLFVCSKNGNSREEGGLVRNSLRGGGMDIFWNYILANFHPKFN